MKKRKKVFLHIGTFKTGSTSLQFHMHRNRALLLRNHIYYGDYFDNYYLHSNIGYGLLKNALIANGCFEKYKDHPRFTNVAEDPEEVIHKVFSHMGPDDSAVISHEALFADSYRTLIGLRTAFDSKEILRINQHMRKSLNNMLNIYFEETEIVCYLRRQDYMIESQYNQCCKDVWYGETNKSLPTFEEFVSYCPIELDYYKNLLQWKRVFDKSDFNIRVYEKSRLSKGLYFDFYVNVLGLPEDLLTSFEEIDKKEQNLRIDRDVLEYKKEFEIGVGKISDLLKQYSLELEKVIDYAYFDTSARKEFLQRYSENNAKLAKEFSVNEDGVLFSENGDMIKEYPGLSREKIRTITKWLFGKMLETTKAQEEK